MRFYFFEFIKTVMVKNSLAGCLSVITDVGFFSWWEREGRGGRERGGNIPCNSLAVAMNVPCATSHSNASKLDAVFVVQCFMQCLLVRREEKREERREERGERREERGERREERGERREEREQRKTTEERKRGEKRRDERRRGERGPAVLMSSTPPCVHSKRLRVYRQDARMSHKTTQ